VATLKDKLDEMAKIKAELQRMETDETVTEEDSGDLRDTLVERYEQLDVECKPIIERMEKVRGITRAAEDPANLERPEGAVGVRSGPEFMQRMDPFADLQAVRQGVVRRGDLISRAQNAIESHDKRGLLFGDRGEEATRKAVSSPQIARHMLLTGSDDYIEAFRTYLNDPQGEGQVARTQLLTSQATAGFMLPYVLDTQIILTNSGSINPYRRIARMETTTSDAWQGVNSAGVGVAWLAEGSQAVDSGSAVGQIQIIPQKAASWVTGSFEMMSDTDYASQLPGMLSDAQYILEEQAFALGTGGAAGPLTGQPLGVLTALGTAQKVANTNGGTAGGGAFGGTANAVQDVYNLNSALGPRFRLSPNVSWVANVSTINKIRSIDQYGGAAFWANLGSGQPERLLDKPIFESPSLNSAGTANVGTAVANGVAVFGDFSKYIIVDRIGSTMLFDPLLKGASTGNIPTGTQGWFYYWRVGAGVAASNAFRWIANS
jgi:HK97 family phage major capsid protein